jgi:acetate kinase
MSFSLLDGLPGANRCGRIDAAAALHLIEHAGLDVTGARRTRMHDAGWLGLPGV